MGVLAGATLLAIVGFLDDGGLLHHQVKLFIGMPIAAIFLIASGIRAQLFSQIVPGIAGLVLDWCLTVVWVVGITAAFSILDHMGSGSAPASPPSPPASSPFPPP